MAYAKRTVPLPIIRTSVTEVIVSAVNCSKLSSLHDSSVGVVSGGEVEELA
jgi:hypothetical protein